MSILIKAYIIFFLLCVVAVAVSEPSYQALHLKHVAVWP